MKFYRYTIILFLLAISVTSMTACLNQKPLEKDPEVGDAKVVEPATDVDPSGAPLYKNLVDGKDISLADMKGQILLVDFWATWCGPCRKEIPGFIELYDKYKDRNVTIVGISVDKGEAVVKKFIENQKINYPVIMSTRTLQSEYEAAINQKIRGIPTTIIINQRGEVANFHVGAPADPKSFFEQEILKLLSEA